MKKAIHHITDKQLTLDDLQRIVFEDYLLELPVETTERIEECRRYLDEKIRHTAQPIYGINTGFGSLYNTHIPPDQLEKLQENLVKSHACGTGAVVPDEIVRLMLFLKVQSLSYGHSGVQLQTVQRLADYFNHQVYPVIYEMGSLGASGDLAPLAHLALTLIGQGEVHHAGRSWTGAEINQSFQWENLHFKAKEGLALLNGTQFMSAYAVWCTIHAHRLLKLANIISALSLDAFDGRIEPFLQQVQAIRPHPGQVKVASSILDLLSGSELIRQPKKHVQDPYSFRCVPQVHGASCDAINYITRTVLTEVNSVTDNPLIFPEDDLIVSGGNFHGQPLALALDHLSIALAELGSISERRTYQLISGARNLPNYLVAEPGINSGLMIPQYTAASLVSQNKQLCTPASVDSIVSSNGQEDHVSMGANAATKAYRVVNNLYSILAIELLSARQAIEFRRPLHTSPYLEEILHTLQEVIPFVKEDRVLHDDIHNVEVYIRNVKLHEQ
ncbi:MAG: histidine ammonia-lyase [Cyclobacteriaceae bacterium]|jgi:histidine ammonia-lyase|nr:histidine ammonia-lyase [Cyclobacteriaceae bacterium]